MADFDCNDSILLTSQEVSDVEEDRARLRRVLKDVIRRGRDCPTMTKALREVLFQAEDALAKSDQVEERVYEGG